MKVVSVRKQNESEENLKCFLPDSLPCLREIPFIHLISICDLEHVRIGTYDLATKLLTQLTKKIKNIFFADSLNISFYTMNIEAKK